MAQFTQHRKMARARTYIRNRLVVPVCEAKLVSNGVNHSTNGGAAANAQREHGKRRRDGFPVDRKQNTPTQTLTVTSDDTNER